MDGNMQHNPVKLSTLFLAASWPLLATVATARVQASGFGPQQYCNEQYMYCVSLPSSGRVEPHQGDAPNHGFKIDLLEPPNVAWSYTQWDAALLQSSQKAALYLLGILLDEHPSGEVSMRPAVIAGLSAYRIRFSYTDIRPMTEELVVAYRRPKDESKGPGIIYEIGLKCSQSSYSANISILDGLVGTFRRIGE
jgi:hypothetical protein